MPSQPRVKRLLTFPITDELRRALERVREEVGIPVAVQIRRGIELWLEGRRFGDLRRWEARQTPGVLDWPNFEAASPIFSANPRARCFPIPRSEREANPNIPNSPT